jgi:hypothetical protein
MKEAKTGSIEVRAKLHFHAGNTYFAAKIYQNDQLTHTLPLQYGYGEQYLYEAKEELGLNAPLWMYCRDNNIKFSYGADDKGGKGYTEAHLKTWIKGDK